MSWGGGDWSYLSSIGVGVVLVGIGVGVVLVGKTGGNRRRGGPRGTMMDHPRNHGKIRRPKDSGGNGRIPVELDRFAQSAFVDVMHEFFESERGPRIGSPQVAPRQGRRRSCRS